MEDGIEIKVIWFDQDVIEVSFRCSNGYFVGQAEIYLGYDDLPKMADSLSRFPTSPTDVRDLEIGTFDPNGAQGGARMHFYCRDSSGHAVLELKLRGGACMAIGEVESVALRIPVEAAAIDSFILELRAMDKTVSGSACLRMAN
jgi:hypothetical protein